MPVIKNPRLTIDQAEAMVHLIDDALEDAIDLEYLRIAGDIEYLRNVQAKLHVALAEAKRGV